MPVDQTTVEKGHKRSATQPSLTHNPWVIGAAGIVVLVLVFAAGYSTAQRKNNRRSPVGSMIGSSYGYSRRFGRGFGGHFDMNSANRVSGVVTSVNGNNFTIAGNGSTATVVTNNSTQYTGGNQVKVNDSVLVFGTSNNGTFTATQVIINSGRNTGPAV